MKFLLALAFAALPAAVFAQGACPDANLAECNAWCDKNNSGAEVQAACKEARCTMCS